ncbi:MAG TPA: hypothetical protein VKA10_09990 [Prolixibacteraceae bacterium]|nr:hypothetical protein [Prolixibacteraceae bacterium]
MIKPVKRLSKRVAGPSIKDALAGKFKEDKLSASEQHQIYTKADELEEFTAEQLKQKWEEFLKRLKSRPNLKSTLSNVPELKEDFGLYLEIENTVQENLINGIKPELISFLRKELKNSKINLSLHVTEKVKGKLIYTDSERFDELVKKNPNLALLKQKFKLDFGG